MARLVPRGKLVTADPRSAAALRSAGRLRASDTTLAVAVAAAVTAASAVALWLRLTGLFVWDGTLSIDEARLALAARGILEHGVPELPSGWVYTRGLLAAYAVVPSFALLGQNDVTARLPSVVAGTALVPAMFLLGHTVAGRAGGLFAAAFVAIYSPLVVWSRQAWFYALFVLLFTVALLFILRAHQRGGARDQLLAGLFVGLTFFTHEVGAFLLLPLGVQAALRVSRSRADPRAWRSPLASLGLAGASLVILWALVTSLRADTLAGPHGELDEYFSPHLELASLYAYVRILFDGRGLVLAAALLGIPLALARRRGEVLLLWLAFLVPFVHAVAIIPPEPQDKYGLIPMVVLIALAAESGQAWAAWAVGRFQSPRPSPGLLAGLILTGILIVHEDVERSLRSGVIPPRTGAWLREARALGIGPDDLVMSDLPTQVGWYQGGLDFWISSSGYHKYTLEDGDVRRDVHTGAILVRNVAEFQRLVAAPNAGRTLWVIGSGRSYQWGELVDDDFKAYLDRSASRRFSTGDNSRILRIELR
jgi:hypothetical protein